MIEQEVEVILLLHEFSTKQRMNYFSRRNFAGEYKPEPHNNR